MTLSAYQIILSCNTTTLSLSQISYITAYWNRTGNLELYIKCILKLIISYLFMHKCISLHVRLMHSQISCMGVEFLSPIFIVATVILCQNTP